MIVDTCAVEVSRVLSDMLIFPSLYPFIESWVGFAALFLSFNNFSSLFLFLYLSGWLLDWGVQGPLRRYPVEEPI